MPSFLLHFSALFLAPHFSFPANAIVDEEIALRWIHIIAGIVWIGLLYFFVLVGGPSMQRLEGTVRWQVFPVLMSRAMAWFRWSALVTVVFGFRYYLILLQADAANSGQSGVFGKWIAEWFGVWIVAYGFLYMLQMPFKFPGSWAVRPILIAIVVIVASWIILDVNAGPEVSNAHLSISVGGGLGFIMLLNAWGIVWRVQKKMIQWTHANLKDGAPIPERSARMLQFSGIASRTAFWLSFPMLFFMAAAEHYPFLSSLGH